MAVYAVLMTTNYNLVLNWNKARLNARGASDGDGAFCIVTQLMLLVDLLRLRN